MLKFNCKIEKLLKSVEAFFAEIKEKGLATDANKLSCTLQTVWSKKFPKVDCLITMATETNILEVLVTFIKQTEFINNDPATFLWTCWRCQFRSGITEDKSWNALKNDGHKTGIR